jgi:hypothetical protein
MAGLVLLLAAALLAQEPSEGPSHIPANPRTQAPRPTLDPALKAIGQALSHPFRDNGKRFDAYPYAGDGPYFQTSRLSTKMYAVMFETTYGRIEHDVLSFGSEVMVSWSAGCDVRMDSFVIQEEFERDTEWTELHHIHLDIGGYEGPNTVDYSIGFGLSALDEEDSYDFGPSLRASLRWFPLRPFSLRLDAVGSWFGAETAADVRGGIGVHIHRLAITAGVRSLLRSDGDDFIGPTIGFSVYF